MKSFSIALILSVMSFFSFNSYSLFLNNGCTISAQNTHTQMNMMFNEPVSTENEQFVRALLTQLGINEKVKNIVKIDAVNAAVGPAPWLGEGSYFMLLGEEWFNSMNQRQKIALIGHEAHHIVCGHCENSLSPWNEDHMAQSRRQEEEADMKGCTFFNCFDGGLMLFLDLYSKHGDYPFNPSNSHPTLKTRMTYLLVGLKENDPVHLLPRALVEHMHKSALQVVNPQAVYTA